MPTCADVPMLRRELAGKQLQQILQPNSSSSTCAELQQDVAELSALHQELSEETQQQLLPLLGQVGPSTQRLTCGCDQGL